MSIRTDDLHVSQKKFAALYHYDGKQRHPNYTPKILDPSLSVCLYAACMSLLSAGLYKVTSTVHDALLYGSNLQHISGGNPRQLH